MSHLPISPPSREEQQGIMHQIYLLMGKQVCSYHKHRRMGNNSSVPVELAQELMDSIWYTVDLAGGAYAHESVEDALRLGQQVLETRVAKAKTLLELVDSTAPQWQTECRWEALCCLRRYLERYDHLHLAQKGPDDLFYPVPVSLPEGIRGIDSCLFYLNILWIENQIMAGVCDAALEQFWDRLPADTLNQCESLVVNGIGKALLDPNIDSLMIAPEARMRLSVAMQNATEGILRDAAKRLCQYLGVNGAAAMMYVDAVAARLKHFTGEGFRNCVLDQLFL